MMTTRAFPRQHAGAGLADVAVGACLDETAEARRPLFAAAARAVLEWLARRDEQYRLRRTLEELDDRTLRDIGVTRADVARELRRRPLPWSL